MSDFINVTNEVAKATIAADGSAALYAGKSLLADGIVYESNGSRWDAITDEYTVSSGLPFVVPSSGNITSTSGSVTVTTAFNYAIGPSYTFFPQSALFAKSPSGWYYTVWSSTTVGKVYADVYYIGTPKVPTNPTQLTTVVGAYTQVKDYYAVGPSYIVPGKLMGSNGAIEWSRQVGCKSSATAKAFAGFFGMETFQGGNITTNVAAGQAGSLVNRGVPTRQCAANSAYGDSGLASAMSRLIVDTDENQIFSFRVKLADPTDFAIVEAHKLVVSRGE